MGWNGRVFIQLKHSVLDLSKRKLRVCRVTVLKNLQKEKRLDTEGTIFNLMEKRHGSQLLNAGADEFKSESRQKSSILNVGKHGNKLIEGTADASQFTLDALLLKNKKIIKKCFDRTLFMGLSAGVNNVKCTNPW